MRKLALGDALDPRTKAPTGRFELDPTDLATHGCIIGMTGSGKTGLGIVLIEECLKSGVSVVAVDPKGDLGNLLLLFPDLAAADFARFADPQQAAGQTQEPAGERARKAALEGLASAGLSASDVRALKEGHEARLYTPGSSAGLPLSLLSSLAAPPRSTPEDDLRESVATVASGLLSLAGIDPDPLRSREAVLLQAILIAAWREGKDLRIEDLVQAVIKPPFDRLGALALETAFPMKERAQLATTLNNLLASPSFAGFLEGEPLDVAQMVGEPGGKPRLSIISIAHLGDAERLFVTALLAERVRAWMRSQPGTSELRLLFYLDEVFGYLPPHPANPPPKPPLLTLLKQARAFGVGLVLATQNPVDLDYKALANMGTWMIGRLQTEQDQARLSEGLSAAIRTQGGDPQASVGLLSALEKRVFLIQDAHRRAPELVRSRYAMSYLRGPLTRADLERLTAGEAKTAGRATPAPAPATRPAVPAWLKERFWRRQGGAFLRPHLLIKAVVRYRVDKGSEESRELKAFPLQGQVASEVLEGEALVVDEAALVDALPGGASFDDLDPALLADRKAVERAIKDRLADRLAASFFFDPTTRQLSHPDEAAEAFALRLGGLAGSGKAKTLGDKIELKKLDLQAAERDLEGRKREKWTAVGTAVLTNVAGFLFGRRRTISGAGTVMSKNRMEDNAEARIEKMKAELGALELERKTLTEVDPGRFETRRIVPGRGDVDVLRIELLWVW